MKLTELEAAAEAILFAAGEPVDVAGIALATGQDANTAKNVVRALGDKLLGENRGVEIIEIDGAFQMRTRPEYYHYINKLYQNPKRRSLSQTLLETLAIIAYRQPVTRGQIEEIRGVNADHAVSKLVEYGLVCEMGRMDAPGRPILFGTTEEFLRHYGFRSPETLPALNTEDDQLRLEAEHEADAILNENTEPRK